MSLNYYNIFRQKTGVDSLQNPWTESAIDDYLDQASYMCSFNYATPWSGFSSVPEKYKYGITLLGALEYWWKALAESVTKFDVSLTVKTDIASQKASTVFDRILKMITMLQLEIEEYAIVEDGPGDIIIGDLVKRSKFTGYLIPRSDDSNGNWLS